MSRRTIAVGLGLSLAIFLTDPGLSYAQQDQEQDRCKEEQDAEDAGGKNYKTVIGPDGRKIFVIQRAFVVCGKVPKPQVIYVLQQRSINYEWETLKQDFLPKILDSVTKEPF